MAAATLQAVSAGRFVLGLGASTAQLTEGLHDVPFAAPVDRLRHVIVQVRTLLAGDRIPLAATPAARPLRLGIPAETVTVSGIPIDPVFAAPKDRRAMRAKHSLDPDRATLLVSAGGFGVGPVERLVRSLLELQHPAQAVVVCGRSAPLKARLDALAATVPTGHAVRLTVVGYTT